MFLRVLSDPGKVAREHQLFPGHQLLLTSPAEPRGTWASSHRELPGGTAKRGHQGPQVEYHTHPAGGHLDPEGGPAPSEEGLNGGIFITVEERTQVW